jgi:hypothetical protein
MAVGATTTPCIICAAGSYYIVVRVGAIDGVHAVIFNWGCDEIKSNPVSSSLDPVRSDLCDNGILIVTSVFDPVCLRQFVNLRDQYIGSQ